jgi:glycerol kinase
MSFVLALDQGTTSSRAIVFDETGAVRGVAQREFRQIFPQPGWVEHDPRDIWATQLAVAQEAIARAGLTAGDLAAIGITNQRETTLLWERATGRPLANAIVWQDRRTADACERLRRAGKAIAVRRKTGLVPDAYFSATKLAWLLDRVPGARRRATRGELAFGTVDTWLVWNLTGGAVHATDPSNASRTMLFNLARGDWDEGLLKTFRIPRSVLPAIVPSSGVLGETAPGLFGARIPIAGIAGDQQASLFGQRCVKPGMVKNTYGTGCFMLMHTGARRVVSRNRLLTTVAWRADAAAGLDYALEGSVFIAGAVVQWLRDGLKLIRSSADIGPLAASEPDAGGVVFVPAFAGLGSPYWDPYARGTVVGLTRGTTAGHLARAALESIAFQTVDVLDAMTRDAGRPLKELRVDGGAARNDLLMQFQADLAGVPVVRSAVAETTALGAAYLAGRAAGVWRSDAEIDRQWRADRRFEPAMPRRVAARRIAEWRRAVERSRDWARD